MPECVYVVRLQRWLGLPTSSTTYEQVLYLAPSRAEDMGVPRQLGYLIGTTMLDLATLRPNS